MAALTDSCGLSPEAAALLSPSDLAKGCGQACCTVLNHCLDRVLDQQGRTRLERPCYNDAEQAVVEEIEEHKDGGVEEDEGAVGRGRSGQSGQSGQSGRSGRVGGGSDEEEGGGGVGGEESDEEYFSGGIRRGPDACLSAPWDLKQLFSMADEETRSMWRVECERVGPALQRMNRELKQGGGRGTSSAWRLHLNTLSHHLGQIAHATALGGSGGSGGRGVAMLFGAPNSLPWSMDLAALKRGEPLLRNLFQRMQEEYQEVVQQSTAWQLKVEERKSRVSEYAMQMTDISERNSVVKEEVQRVGADVSDTSPLQVGGTVVVVVVVVVVVAVVGGGGGTVRGTDGG